ncbi:hypothetical protein LEP1GSC131_1233 [Leptospira kirschneri str. 200802841]|uniref:Uncharacterized protein n=1 Tax=Leptospira kirschneri str. 200802841 TaxID=1193047 RepID=A0A828Y521_9LEPT|nr:hypothetical protein LEP1GSC131_1233 [Leptospira kirschneri str. 200802841]
MVKLNHSQILVNLFHSEEFLKCVKKERVQRLYLKKKETSNPNPWFLSKIVIWCQTMDVGFLFEIRPVLFV